MLIYVNLTMIIWSLMTILTRRNRHVGQILAATKFNVNMTLKDQLRLNLMSYVINNMLQ